MLFDGIRQLIPNRYTYGKAQNQGLNSKDGIFKGRVGSLGIEKPDISEWIVELKWEHDRIALRPI